MASNLDVKCWQCGAAIITVHPGDEPQTVRPEFHKFTNMIYDNAGMAHVFCPECNATNPAPVLRRTPTPENTPSLRKTAIDRSSADEPGSKKH